MSILKPSYIVIRPVTPRGKHVIAKMQIGGDYSPICEARSEFQANEIKTAMNLFEHTIKLEQLKDRAIDKLEKVY
jgi:hypothetical protein